MCLGERQDMAALLYNNYMVHNFKLYNLPNLKFQIQISSPLQSLSLHKLGRAKLQNQQLNCTGSDNKNVKKNNHLIEIGCDQSKRI